MLPIWSIFVPPSGDKAALKGLQSKAAPYSTVVAAVMIGSQTKAERSSDWSHGVTAAEWTQGQASRFVLAAMASLWGGSHYHAVSWFANHVLCPCWILPVWRYGAPLLMTLTADDVVCLLVLIACELYVFWQLRIGMRGMEFIKLCPNKRSTIYFLS